MIRGRLQELGNMVRTGGGNGKQEFVGVLQELRDGGAQVSPGSTSAPSSETFKTNVC